MNEITAEIFDVGGFGKIMPFWVTDPKNPGAASQRHILKQVPRIGEVLSLPKLACTVEEVIWNLADPADADVTIFVKIR